jgi:serine/threonine protein kinase
MSNPSISSWQAIKVIGKGGSSVVYKARVNENGQIVAVKQIDTDGLSKDQISSLKGEIETIKELHHPNIISYYGTQQALNKINIFLEYADRGSLRQFYQKKGPMSESQVINCTRQILGGLQYLHNKGIAHRDIKCANCLLTQKGVVKLADFGSSKRFESESLVSGLKGTPNWMAPEVIKGTQMTSGWLKADVWSVGCTMVEMLTSKMPFAEYDNPMTAMYHIANGKAPNLDVISCSNQIKDFIRSCCNANPSSRPAVRDLLAHPLLIKKSELSPSPYKGKQSPQPAVTSPLMRKSLSNMNNTSSAGTIDDEDEVYEELEVQECTTDLIDEVESVEDETEVVEQDSIPIIYSEESSQMSDANVSFLSEVNHETPPRERSLPPKESLSPATSATHSNSGSLTESSSSLSMSRKGFPRPFRLSDQLSKVSSPKVSSTATSSSHLSFYGDHVSVQYSQSAPSSRVNTATGSLESSPRAKNRSALASLSTAEKLSDKLQAMTQDLQSLDLETSQIFAQVC